MVVSIFLGEGDEEVVWIRFFKDLKVLMMFMF